MKAKSYRTEKMTVQRSGPIFFYHFNRTYNLLYEKSESLKLKKQYSFSQPKYLLRLHQSKCTITIYVFIICCSVSQYSPIRFHINVIRSFNRQYISLLYTEVCLKAWIKTWSRKSAPPDTIFHFRLKTTSIYEYLKVYLYI